MTKIEFHFAFSSALPAGDVRAVRLAMVLGRATDVEHVTLETCAPGALWCTAGLEGNGIAYSAPWHSWGDLGAKSDCPDHKGACAPGAYGHCRYCGAKS